MFSRITCCWSGRAIVWVSSSCLLVTSDCARATSTGGRRPTFSCSSSSQVAAEVQNAITALHAAESAADAATKSRELQAQLLAASQEKLQRRVCDQSVGHRAADLSGAGTNHRGNGQGDWLKAAVQLDRVLGRTLENNGISLKADQTQVDSQQH